MGSHKYLLKLLEDKNKITICFKNDLIPDLNMNDN